MVFQIETIFLYSFIICLPKNMLLFKKKTIRMKTNTIFPKRSTIEFTTKTDVLPCFGYV